MLALGGLVILVLFLYLPIITTVLISFDSRTYLAYLPPPSLSLRWYSSFLGNSFMIDGLKNSIVLGAMSTLFSTVIGILASFGMVRFTFKGKNILGSFFLSPLTVPGIVVGFALLNFMALAGIRVAFYRLLVAHIIITVPYAIRTITATLIGFDVSLEEAAMNLGARPIRTFLDVTLPLIKPGVIAGAVFAFAMSLDDVAVSVFLVDAYTSTLPVTLFAYMKAQFNPTTAAASVMLMGFTFLVILVIEKTLGLDNFVGIAAPT